MPTILRINCKEKNHRFEEPEENLVSLGGRGLTSRIVLDEVPPTCHALSSFNKLVIAPGLLSGTAAANSGRISVGAKSPLTGGIKESNAGGLVSQKLARLGIKAVVLEDKPEDASYSLIILKKDSVEILPADEYQSLGNYDVITKLWGKYGKGVGVMCIGPGGEQRLTSASIQFADPRGHAGRAAGRGGLGAVMGSKGIKAIVVDDKGADRVPIAIPEAFKAAHHRWVEMINAHPVSGQALPAYGTPILVNLLNEAGGLPTKNFRSGRFEHANEISGERMTELIEKRGGVVKEGCHPGCIIHCSQAYHDKDGHYLTSGFEYETIWAFGAHTLIKDIDDIAMMDRLCDDIGVDTIEMGVAIGLAMEGGLIPWGDGKAAIDASGLCLFTVFPVLDNEDGVQTIVDLINARYGIDWSTDDFVDLGVSILKTEFAFNSKAGLTKAHDRLPDMFRETLPPHNNRWDFADEELQKVKQLGPGGDGSPGRFRSQRKREDEY